MGIASLVRTIVVDRCFYFIIFRQLSHALLDPLDGDAIKSAFVCSSKVLFIFSCVQETVGKRNVFNQNVQGNITLLCLNDAFHER
jgi:hypothetical protein